MCGGEFFNMNMFCFPHLWISSAKEVIIYQAELYEVVIFTGQMVEYYQFCMFQGNKYLYIFRLEKYFQS